MGGLDISSPHPQPGYVPPSVGMLKIENKQTGLSRATLVLSSCFQEGIASLGIFPPPMVRIWVEVSAHSNVELHSQRKGNIDIFLFSILDKQ